MHKGPHPPTADRLQRELRAAARQANTARLESESRRKDRFIATVAHELRNMMAPLHTALELLDRGRDDAVVMDRALPVARRQVKHMCQLVDELLDIGRIASDQLVLHRQPLQLGQVLQEAAEACELMFGQRGQQLQVHLSPSPVWILGDPVRWAQVALNLLHNASKFTPEGGAIRIDLDLEDRITAVCRVRDSGRGIARGELEAVFELFHREQPHGVEPGLGIGLALVRRIVELHGGTIHAESAGPGRGSTFVVRVPMLLDRGLPSGACA
ncbi:MAG TPA: HAMP domain-containing sensor histidine kinase [Ramlibacter sp.]|nr:HAMP domain-containing sensor histidine kinase [Ramlibacter sp.]